MFIPPCGSLHKVTFPRMQFRNFSYIHYDHDIHPRLVQSRPKLDLPYYDKYYFERGWLTKQVLWAIEPMWTLVRYKIVPFRRSYEHADYRIPRFYIKKSIRTLMLWIHIVLAHINEKWVWRLNLRQEKENVEFSSHMDCEISRVPVPNSEKRRNWKGRSEADRCYICTR